MGDVFNLTGFLISRAIPYIYQLINRRFDCYSIFIMGQKSKLGKLFC